MAIIHKLEKIELQRPSVHTEANATYCIVETREGKMLQIDTYGSAERKFEGKKSQSLRFSPQAIEQLKALLVEF